MTAAGPPYRRFLEAGKTPAEAAALAVRVRELSANRAVPLYLRIRLGAAGGGELETLIAVCDAQLAAATIRRLAERWDGEFSPAEQGTIEDAAHALLRASWQVEDRLGIR